MAREAVTPRQRLDCVRLSAAFYAGKSRYLPHDNAVPRKIRELVADLQRAGFTRMPGGGKGSHRKFVHPRFRGFVLISGPNGGEAQPYQEKHVRNALRQLMP